MNKEKFKIYLYFKPLIIKLWTEKTIHKLNQQTILFKFIKISSEEFYDNFNYFEQVGHILPYYQQS